MEQKLPRLVIAGTNSGCGKTTTLKMINRLITASSGRMNQTDSCRSVRSAQPSRRTIPPFSV